MPVWDIWKSHPSSDMYHSRYAVVIHITFGMTFSYISYILVHYFYNVTFYLIISCFDWLIQLKTFYHGPSIWISREHRSRDLCSPRDHVIYVPWGNIDHVTYVMFLEGTQIMWSMFPEGSKIMWLMFPHLSWSMI